MIQLEIHLNEARFKELQPSDRKALVLNEIRTHVLAPEIALTDDTDLQIRVRVVPTPTN